MAQKIGSRDAMKREERDGKGVGNPKLKPLQSIKETHLWDPQDMS